MPTGYTADIYDGKDVTFKGYALRCARAFGACIELRDEPLSSEVPKLKQESYHTKMIVEAQDALQEWTVSGVGKRCELFQKFVEEAIEGINKGIRESEIRLLHYENVLKSVLDYVPPTPDHTNFKKFMIEQLESSIEHDCGTDYYYKELERFENLTFEKWQEEKMSSLMWNLNYHIEGEQKELSKNNDNSDWIKKLVDSL